MPFFAEEFNMNRKRKFLSYYKPYLGVFFADMFFAFTAAAISSDQSIDCKIYYE